MKSPTINSNSYLQQATKAYSTVSNIAELNKAKAKFLGQKSDLVLSFVYLKSLSDINQKKKLGTELNKLRKSIEDLHHNAHSKLLEVSSYKPIDVTAPSSVSLHGYGHMHPTTTVLKETYEIFTKLGFSIVDSDEIETDWYNFEALNMPINHPAREMQDTFYIDNSKGNLLPRSHTSGMQVRFMENNEPPFKIIVPGRVFRNENEDATHAWIFNQVEGLVVGENVAMADLKGTLLEVVKGLLGEDADIRFRASYFPYTEPSVELDCKYKGEWLELGGAGMVHPQVLKNGGINPNIYSGFAFGWGAERIAVIKYGLTDLRELWRPRFSFLEQF